MSRAFALLRRISLALVLCAAAAPVGAAFLFDPALRFRIVTTEHFVIYFHQGEEHQAARLASIAEGVWQELRESFDVAPPGRTHVVLVDQGELANGMASPLPFDTIVVTASAPAGSEFIARTDDWLTLVFTHEFTHIVHLDRSIGWARVVRDVFGRVPLAMPNLFLPVWQVEGLATYEESRLTGQGRLTAGDFRAIEREASRAGRPEPLDRVNGGLIDWPSGLAAYSSGLGFHAYLAEKYGADKQAELAAGTAGRVPFTQSPLFKRVYGRSLGALWREYEASTLENLDASATNDEPTRLTRRGFEASGPRFAGPPCDGCPDEIVYAAVDPHGFPALYAVNRDGSGSHRLTTRYLGSTTGVSASALVFDEHELHRNVALHSDLFWLDRRTNHVEALTSGARLVDPDLAPDGRSIVCAREGSGQRELVVLRLDSGAGTPSITPKGKRTVSDVVTITAEPGTQFNAPRWSPDGRLVAAERHRLGSLPEIVVVDVATKSVRGVAALANARIVTPAWRPDGQAIIAAVQLDDRPFNLFEFPIDGSGDGRQLTHASGGATWPDISPDGHTIAFVGYTTDGFDLFTVPYPAGNEGARLSAAPSNLIQAPSPAPEADLAQRAQAPYSPWPTLSPTYWTPVIESDSDQVRLGVATGGLDVLGYHGYSASATWLVSGPETTTRPSSATPDWEATYAYSRWRPTLFLSASSQSSFFTGPPPSPNLGAAPIGTLREQQIEGGILLPVQHVRVGHRAFAAVLKWVDDYALPQRSTRIDRTSGRLGWSTNTAKVYGYSISPEHGVTAGTTAELVRRALGASGDATTYTADARAYLPGFFSRHVLALRAAGASSTGEAAVRKVFFLGGPDASSGVLDFGSGAFHLLRAFPSEAFAGSHVAVINADYRLPIATPQRGAGTWPLFVRTIHAAVFADAGHAWSKSFAVADAKTAGGAELAFDVVVGYRFPFTLTVGAAAGRDGQAHASSSAAYFRIGLAF